MPAAERKDVHRQGSPGSPRKEEPAWRRQQQQQAQQQLQAQRRRQEQQEAEEQPELTPKLGKPEPVRSSCQRLIVMRSAMLSSETASSRRGIHLLGLATSMCRCATTTACGNA